MVENKLTPLFLFDDEPVRAHTDDHLALKPFSSMIAAAALGNRGPFNIGVFSGWGQGKTSVLRQARSLIEAQKKPHIVTAWVNAWQYEHEEHPIVPLLAVIINEISKTLDERKTALEKVGEGTGKLLKDLSRTLRSIAYGFSAKTDVKIPGFAGLEVGFVAKDMIDRDEKLSADRDPLLDQSLYYHAYDRLERFREQLEKTSLTDQPRIVVFIDDLDRCQPDKALHLLESLKLVLAQPGFIFVLAVDRRVIDAFLTKRYHDEFGIAPDKLHGKQYMDKIIQLPLDLPHHHSRFDKYIWQMIHDPRNDGGIPQEFKELFSDDEAGEAFVSAIAAGCSRSPRTLIRILNYLLTDFFLRKNGFFIENRDPFGNDHCEFLRFAAVSRITRITFGSERDELYRKLVASEKVCVQFSRFLEKKDSIWHANADDPEWGFHYPGGEEDLKETIDALEPFRMALLSSESLYELFRSDIGLRWLKEHDKRQVIESYLATREDSPLEENSAQVIYKIISKDIGLNNIQLITEDVLCELKRLDLTGCQVTDLALLQSIRNLEFLSLAGTQVSDCGYLENLKRLRVLYLAGTRVADLSFVKSLSNLEILVLHDTPVKNVEPLRQLSNLIKLDLRSTQVSDVRLLHHLKKLELLRLKDSPVSKDAEAISDLQSALPKTEVRL